MAVEKGAAPQFERNQSPNLKVEITAPGIHVEERFDVFRIEDSPLPASAG
jgi:hypothetical protein